MALFHENWVFTPPPPAAKSLLFIVPWATGPITSSAFALCANVKLYILVPELTNILPFSGRKLGNLSILMLDSEIWYVEFLDTMIKIQEEPKFLFVCQFVSWFTSSLKLDKYRDISSSGWDIFLKFSGDIPRIFLDYFKIIMNFCMSVSLLVGLLPFWN